MANSKYSWFRKNLFKNFFDGATTVIISVIVITLLYKLMAWAIASADWRVIGENSKVLIAGIYPDSDLWRVKLFFLGIAGLVGICLSKTVYTSHQCLIIGVSIQVVITAFSFSFLPYDIAPWILCSCVLMTGAWVSQKLPQRVCNAVTASVFVLNAISIILAISGHASDIGGLLLSLILTLGSAIAVIPIGILLALGRQSRRRTLSSACAGFIETIRALPLILVVYGVWVSVPLLMPDVQVSDLNRALLGFTIFYSAYAAEYIRSGLQSVPMGQNEAAQSLGLSNRDTTTLVVLPQALRVAIPALAGNILDIFNYAPIVFIIGMSDFLKSGQLILSNPQYGMVTNEVYGFLFFTCLIIGCLTTFFTRRLEAYYKGGVR